MRVYGILSKNAGKIPFCFNETRRARTLLIIKIILKSNGWKYEGKLTNFDGKYIELYDFVSKSYKIVEIYDINNLEVRE